MNDEQIKHMVNRFLGWKLPEDFRPDCGIVFDADAAKKLNPNNARYEPNGTNVLNYTQAEQMVRFMLVGLPETTTKEVDDSGMPDVIYAGKYHDQEPQNEWRERKMTGSTKYIRAEPAQTVDVDGLLYAIADYISEQWGMGTSLRYTPCIGVVLGYITTHYTLTKRGSV